MPARLVHISYQLYQRDDAVEPTMVSVPPLVRGDEALPAGHTPSSRAFDVIGFDSWESIHFFKMPISIIGPPDACEMPCPAALGTGRHRTEHGNGTPSTAAEFPRLPAI